MSRRVWFIVPALVAIAAVPHAATQAPTAGRLDEVIAHGASIEKNLLGISADRAVSVYLPPSYDRSTRRFPVLYVLHGIMDSHRTWTEA